MEHTKHSKELFKRLEEIIEEGGMDDFTVEVIAKSFDPADMYSSCINFLTFLEFNLVDFEEFEEELEEIMSELEEEEVRK